jgi:DeoR/GlpR family transcriptional regulator of sugar metabolism
MKKVYQKEILDILEKTQFITVEDLSKRLFISPSSVRRYLKDAQDKGLLIRTHGGAKIVSTNNLTPSFSFRSKQSISEKKKIAKLAVSLVNEGDVVFLDGSTSAFFMADYLKDVKNVKVITNGIDTLSLLSKNEIDAYSTGGKISNVNRSALVGQKAVDIVNAFHADVAFFSAHSVDKNGYVYDCFEEENHLRIAMMKNSTKKILLCDSTKFNSPSPYKLCELKDVDYLICDTDISKNYQNVKLPKIIF